MKLILRLYCWFLYTISKFSPAVLLAMRLWIADVFWSSGVLKLQNWDNTLTLFMYEHPVPYLPVPVAAFLGTLFEVTCPVLLALGLASRLATLPLISMTLVINFTYLEADEHYYWLMLLTAILTQGPGFFSLDHLIRRKYGKRFQLA